MLISCLLEVVLSPGVKEIVCMKGIVRFLHMKTHLMIFFSEMFIEKTLEDMSMFVGKQKRYQGTFSFKNS